MAPPLVGINPGQNPIINNPNPEVQNLPLQNPPVQNPPGQNPVQNPPVQNPPPENNPADGFENIDVPLLQEALDKPATTAERILRDPLGVSEKVSEQIAAQPKKFTVWQIIVSVLTFGMAAVYYRDTGFFGHFHDLIYERHDKSIKVCPGDVLKMTAWNDTCFERHVNRLQILIECLLAGQMKFVEDVVIAA